VEQHLASVFGDPPGAEHRFPGHPGVQAQSPSETARVTRAAVLTVLVVLSSSALAGDLVLCLFESSLDAFRVGGGLAPLLIGLSKLARRRALGRRSRVNATEGGCHTAIGVAPLGMPLLAGPGAISTAIIHSQRGMGP
jgi:multiple antibiotic resistance protein